MTDKVSEIIPKPLDPSPPGMARMRFYAYDDQDFNNWSEYYDVLFNPDQLSENINISYSDLQIPKTKGSNLEYNKTLPQSFSLNLLFDSTGVAPDTANGGYVKRSVVDQIKEFKKITVKYVGEKHEPNYVKIVFGSFRAQGRVQSIQFTYTHFSPQGEPIRAKASVSFIATVSFENLNAEQKTSSPDLTHIRTTQDGDTLPLMVDRIYKDPNLYLEVARANQLNHFRKLKPGSKLYFPPLDKNA